MDMPRPDAHTRRLDVLLGTWLGDETIHPSPYAPEGGVASGRIVNRSAFGGLAVIHDYAQTRAGAPNFEGHAVFRYDRDQELYMLHWFDSFGMAPSDYSGDFEGAKLVLGNRSAHGHSRAVYDFSVANRYEFEMQISTDGKSWQPFMQGSYRRE